MADYIAFSDLSRQGKIAYIKKYINSHPEATRAEAARHFGISPRSAYVLRCVPNKTLALEHRIEYYILSHGETSQQDLVNDLNSSHKTMRNHLKKANICLLTRKWHTESKILREYHQGACIGEIAKKLEITERYVKETIRRHAKKN